MTEQREWKRSLRLFFAQRATQIRSAPTVADLCYVSGREPRLWSQPAMYEDMIQSILTLAEITPQSAILEVGCAAGFIAKGIAPRVNRYVGVDLARPALHAARLLKLPNAEFRYAAGSKLPFKDASFDAALCYDVFTNFPRFDEGVPIITEMLRVVKPGGKALVGSLPDKAKEDSYPARVLEVARELDGRFGTAQAIPQATPGLFTRLRIRVNRVKPGITCYYFSRQDFCALGERLGVKVTITDIHSLNPYAGFRFNAIFSKPEP